MATRMRQLMMSALDDLRVHPVGKWIRATIGDATVVDTREALLVWEPRRVVGSYAVPEGHVAGELVPEDATATVQRPIALAGGVRVLDPATPFAAHTASGTPLTIRTPTRDLAGAAFRVDDPELAGYVVLDWAAFTQWFEEDEPVLGHPHDPFDRIDCLRSTRHVQVAVDGVVLADTVRPTLLFETPLPTRYYIPREDVALHLLEPSSTHTVCAYKGRASHWSARVGGTLVPDVGWSYDEPLHDAVPVRGMLAFYPDRVDLTLDGVPQTRPAGPWS